MLKKVLFASALTFLALSTFAQTKKNSVGIQVGGVLPMGKFAATTVDNNATADDPRSGFSNPGWQVGLSYAYDIIPNLGVTARFGYATTYLNTNKVQSWGKENTPNVVDYVVNDADYSWISALVGPRVILPIGNAEIFGDVLVGYVSSTVSRGGTKSSTLTPGRPDSEKVTRNSTTDASTAAALAYGAGIGLRTNITSSVGFLMSVNYLTYTHSGTQNVETTTAEGAGSPSMPVKSSVNVKQPLDNVSINLGVSINF